ncbi:hypothetical protein [Sorangium sp. So ce861]|uniref:hypothetical protein n=1 Tax=Sorangium sp. So ce861 TaxID=3133323 RepID=UPI003F61E74D
MKKSLASLVVLATATLSTGAMAIDIDNKLNVEIDFAFGISAANTLKCDPSFRFDDEDGEILDFPAEFCARVCKVKFEGDLPDSANFYLLEKMTTGNYDCEKFDKDAVVTFVTIDPDRVSKLFFKNEKRKLNEFVGGEDRDGNLWGACSFKGLEYVNYSCSFLAEERDGHEEEEEEEEHTDVSEAPATEG